MMPIATSFFDFASPQNINYLFQGVLTTLEVSVISIIFSFIFGSILGVVRYEEIPYFSRLVGFIVDIIRNLPLLLIIFFIYFALPQFGVHLPIFWSAVVGLTIFEASMLAEIVRGGIRAVGKGQMEGARANGLTNIQAMTNIVLPQAYRKMIPPIISQLISLVKDSSLAVGIGLAEMTYRGQILYSQNSNYIIPVLVTLAIIYFIINFLLSLFARYLEKRIA